MDKRQSNLFVVVFSRELIVITDWHISSWLQQTPGASFFMFISQQDLTILFGTKDFLTKHLNEYVVCGVKLKDDYGAPASLQEKKKRMLQN